LRQDIFLAGGFWRMYSCKTLPFPISLSCYEI
jgi:hypothetical protein